MLIHTLKTSKISVVGSSLVSIWLLNLFFKMPYVVMIVSSLVKIWLEGNYCLCPVGIS
jgi:hypothetical protein